MIYQEYNTGTDRQALDDRPRLLDHLRHVREKEAGQRRDQVLDALKRDLEAARYAVDLAVRQHDAADPANRLVAGELEARWNQALVRLSEIEAKVTAHNETVPADVADPASLAMLALNLKTVWAAPSTDARLKKRIVRAVIQEVVADIDPEVRIPT